MDFASDTCIMTDSIAFLEYRIEWDTVLSECIVQRKRVIARCITWHGNGGGHRGEFPALVTCAYRAMKQMFAPRSVAQSGGDVQAIWVRTYSVSNVIAAKCPPKLSVNRMKIANETRITTTVCA